MLYSQRQNDATVADSAQLRWWLLGFGDYVEVVRRKKLRMEFEKIANNLAGTYRSASGRWREGK